MSGTVARWKADDQESRATAVGGRPVHAFWPLLRGGFAAIFMEPRRRAGGGTVGWRWEASLNAPRPAAQDFAVIRRRMEGALLDFIEDMERRGAGVPGAKELQTVMTSLVGDLVRASDARLSGYVVPTGFGWMIRSWGFAEPAAAVSADALADELAVASAVVAEDAVFPEQGASSSAAGGWRKWALLGAATVLSTGGVVSGMRGCGATPSAVAKAVTPPVSVIAEARAERTANSVAQPAVGSLRRASAGSSSAASASTSVLASGLASDTALTSAPVPVAFTGVMPAGSERKGDRAGPDAHLDGDPESKLTPSNPSAAATTISLKNGAGEHSEGKTPDASGAESAPVMDAEKGGKPAPKEILGLSQVSPTPLRVAQPEETASTIEARKIPTHEILLPPKAGQPRTPVEPMESGEEAEPVEAAIKNPPPVQVASKKPAPGEAWRSSPANRDDARASTARTTPSAADAGDVSTSVEPSQTTAQADENLTELSSLPQAQSAGSGSSLPVRPGLTATASLGSWQTGRVRDVVLATWPTEQSGKEALPAARARALAAARAEMPVSFQVPRIRCGWRVRVADSAWKKTPPVWRDVVSDAVVSETVTARPDGFEVEMTGGVNVRLVSAEGTELARITADATGQTVVIRCGPEVVALVPWFRIEADEGETTVQGWVWRSLSAGWSDVGWEFQRSARALQVACVASAALPAAGPSGGRVALVDEASGWAVIGHWSLRVVYDLKVGR